eukprot:PITA_23213
MNWYLEIELRHGMNDWDILKEIFLSTFSFEDGFKCIDEALQEIKAKIFRMPEESVEWVQLDCDYWDEDIVDKVTELLHEYHDLFPTKFLDLKGIVGDLGVMNITLKPDAKPVKQRPYCLNPKYKKKVCKELEKMLEAEIIEPVEESDWVSLMLVQEKKQHDEI